MAPVDDLSAPNAMRVLARTLRYMAPFRAQFAVKLALTLLTLLSGILLPWPAKIVLDHVIGTAPIEQTLTPYPFFIRPFIALLADASPLEILLWTIAAQLVLLLLFGAVGASARENDSVNSYLASGEDTATRTENEANHGHSFAGGLVGLFELRWTMRLTQSLNHYYRARLYERIQALPITAFDDERIGDAVYRLMYDTPAITLAAYRLLLTPIAAPFGLLVTVGTVALVFPDHHRLVWGAAGFVLIAFFATLPFTGMLRRRARHSREAGAATTATVEEAVANVLAVQSLGGQHRQRQQFDRDSWHSFGRYRGFLRAIIYTVSVAAVPATILVGMGFLYVIDQVVDGRLSLGDFALLVTYFLQATFYSIELGSLWVALQGNAAGLNRVFELMDAPGERDVAGLPALAPVRRSLTAEDVWFEYGAAAPALRGVSFTAQRGEMIALVGPTGAGKTTLAYLIPRFLVPQRGRVRIDGTDIATVSLASLRAQIAFVFQETILFDASVAENIRLGRAGATEIDVRRAARLAGADEFIQALPDGYDTRLGRSGSKLSVGQRQRLALARAFVRDAPILILDEPTSALDIETEKHLVATLRTASRHRMVILIAHRLSIVRAADCILFLDQGRVVEAGSHDELIARPDGAYRRFVELQIRGAA
jgi:ABC-type multidrug transport system fused ATPase/permease subunit